MCFFLNIDFLSDLRITVEITLFIFFNFCVVFKVPNRVGTEKEKRKKNFLQKYGWVDDVYTLGRSEWYWFVCLTHKDFVS